jgi:hypothetical protein
LIKALYVEYRQFCDYSLKQMGFVMTLRSAGVGAVLVALLVASSAHSQGANPFTKLAGQWAGSGTIDLASGATEPIKCRASYDVLEEQNNLQLSIRCASDSYNFDMHASATLASTAVSGTWTEVSRNVAGKISGTAAGDHIDVVADSSAFNASLALVTHGNKQSVVIKSKEANTQVKGATISLQRS